MPFFLRKLIEALFLPIGFSGLLVIAGVITRRRSIALLGVMTLYAFSTQFVGRQLLRPLEQAYEPETVANAPNADAIVILSGSIVRGVNAAGVQWGESGNRFFAGVDLAKAGKAKSIVISMGPAAAQGRILKRAAIDEGIRPERIILTRPVLTTEDEARAVSELPGIRSVLLVTSAFHMPRASLLFRSRGISVFPFSTDERIVSPRFLSLSEFIPTAAWLQSSEACVKEYLGLAVYRSLFLFRLPKV